MTQRRDADHPAVVIAAGIFPDPGRIIEQYGSACTIAFAHLSSAEAIAASTARADAVVVATQRLDPDRLAALASSVRVIGRAGVGLDAIDLEAAKRLGIGVINEPTYGALEVASHAVGLMIAVYRKFTAVNGYVRAGWAGPLSLSPMQPLDELTLGLVGYGNIATEAARMCAPLVGRILTFDPFVAEVPGFVERVDKLDDLLIQSQLLSLHLPLTAQTRGLLGARELALLPDGAVVVNVARGGILDEDALAGELNSGRLGGAGLDVFAQEPLPSGSPLLSTPNTILSPHVAAYSERSSWRLASWTIEDVLSYLASSSIKHGKVVVSGTR
jgi:D-3-phosphoglycerate dehydrogenase / 2-oxoglutarate reductase